jgi:cystathionine gamma-lyase
MDAKVGSNLKSNKTGTTGTGTWFAPEVHIGTALVHAGVAPDPTSGAIITPIVQATTFVQDSIAEYCAKGYSYSRSANPTVTALEERIAAVEGGAAACVFGTGMAATTTIFASLMSAGDHAIITNCSYGGTNRAARVFFTRMGMTFDFVDMRDPANITAALKPNTKVIMTETPANPTLTLIDLPAVTAICRARGITHVCDSTFATPIILRPLDHGVDIVLQSTTKYYDGHNMTVGGAVISATKALDEKIRFHQNVLGNIMSPQVAFLQLQACKTLGLRIRQQSETAFKVATFLEAHPAVLRVMYPGLASFPQKALADKLHRGGLHGGMLWFEVRGGTEAGRQLMDTVQRPWSLCENLGATESIITAPAVMTHANMLKEDREKVGITDGFVRVSCGIEDATDLIAALKIALDNLKA